jgi:SAM-dependent methyltransferase
MMPGAGEMAVNWLELWRDLINANPHSPNSEPIKRYRAHAWQRRQRPDPLLDFVLRSVDGGDTVLDIGAGAGRWTIPLAGRAKAVTAIEPAEDMSALLQENAKSSRVNVRIIQSSWEEALVEPCDIVVCAHAIYSSPDLASFVHKMEQHARKTCYLAIRLPPVDGVIGELSRAIHGCTFDSANAVIAFNALYSLGIYTNIQVENDIYPWVNNTLEEAFARVKRHLHLETNNSYDGLIRDTLSQRLISTQDGYVWPDGMRSALLWWNSLRK